MGQQLVAGLEVARTQPVDAALDLGRVITPGHRRTAPKTGRMLELSRDRGFARFDAGYSSRARFSSGGLSNVAIARAAYSSGARSIARPLSREYVEARLYRVWHRRAGAREWNGRAPARGAWSGRPRTLQARARFIWAYARSFR